MPLYSLLLALTFTLGAPFWLVRLLTNARYRAGLRERLGRIRPALRIPSPQPTLWLHAVSVGELLASTGLLQELARSLPEHRIVLSTTTEAGQRLARERFPNLATFFLPLDFAILLRPLFRTLRPSLLILMESELWPNLIREASRHHCPVVVANARISDRSFPRYRLLRRLWEPILRPVSLFLSQSPETATRLRSIGIQPSRIHLTGNLKFDTPEPRRSPVFHAIAATLPPTSPVLVAGSVLPGEDDLLLQAWPAILTAHPTAILILAPRHPNRFTTVAEHITGQNLLLARASTLPSDHPLTSGTVLLLDTIGDLAAVFSFANAALIGGSLVPAGGHNPLEPARFAIPTAIGSSVHNFRDIVQTLFDANALLHLSPGADLATSLSDLLRPTPANRTLGRNAQAVFLAQAGAARRSVDLILPLLCPTPAEAHP